MPRRNSKGRFVKGQSRAKTRSTAMVRHTGGASRGSSVLVLREGGGKVKRGAHRAASAALATSHITGPALMALGLGYAKKQGWEIPVIGELGEDATIAIAGYAALKFKVVPAGLRKHVANLTLAALVLAAHDIGETGNIPGIGKKEATTSGAGGKRVSGGGAPQYEAYVVK